MRVKTIASTTCSLLLAAALWSCARTDVSSFTDPSYELDAPYRSVMIAALGMAFDEVDVTESTVVSQFDAAGIRAVRRVDFMLPTRQYSSEEVLEILDDSGVDTVLFISLAGQDATQTFVPPVYVPGQTSGTVNVIGNTAFFNSYTAPGYTVGGYNVSKPVAAYTATLMDAHSGATVWVATARSKGNAFATYSDLAQSMGAETVKKLLSDKIF